MSQTTILENSIISTQPCQSCLDEFSSNTVSRKTVINYFASLNQNRYFLTQWAFDECISICASGQNPSGLDWIPPGSCPDSNFCGEDEFCEGYDDGGVNNGFCVPCERYANMVRCPDDMGNAGAEDCERICRSAK